MSKIFVGQFLRLVIDTKIDLTEATSVKIAYTTPSGTVGEWSATKDPDVNTKIIYDIPVLEEAGVWNIYAKAIFVEGIIRGEETILTVTS